MLDKLIGILWGAVKPVLRYPSDAIVLSSKALRRRVDEYIARSAAFLDNPSLTAKFLPYGPDGGSYVLLKRDDEPGGPGFPVPPRALWEGYGETEEEWLTSGQIDWRRMMEIVAASGFAVERGHRILDFGCAGGRLIRHFDNLAAPGAIVGVDISAPHIAWCQRHLSPPFTFVTTTTFPHLPFEDRYFDFVYSGSVFTHIADLADAWLLELRRVLRPGGRLYVTVHDDHTLALLDKQYVDFALARTVKNFDRETGFRSLPFGMVSIARSPRKAQVFYDREYLTSQWGRYLTIRSVTPEAYGYQSAVLLEK
jgi:ubiquinone/menaquinone biosynthesis C-methylase UbiE